MADLDHLRYDTASPAWHQVLARSEHAQNVVNGVMCLTGCQVPLQVAGYMRLLVSLGAPLPLILRLCGRQRIHTGAPFRCWYLGGSAPVVSVSAGNQGQHA